MKRSRTATEILEELVAAACLPSSHDPLTLRLRRESLAEKAIELADALAAGHDLWLMKFCRDGVKYHPDTIADWVRVKRYTSKKP